MAAYTAAKAGLKVVLIDKCSFPRYKTCGRGLTQRTLQALPFSVDSVIEQNTKRVEIRFLNSGLRFEIKRLQTVVAMTMRDRFDALLVEHAQGVGANFKEDTSILSIQTNTDFLEVQTSKGIFKTKYVIAADGANGPTAKLAGFNDERIRVPAVEYETKVSQAVQNQFSDVTRIDFEVLSGGYGWVFPKKNHLSIGVGICAPRNVNLHAATLAYMSKLGIDPSDVLEIQKHGYMIPISPRNRLLARGRVFLVGDSAGLADPVTFEGIYPAIESGKLAAHAIIQNIDAHERACLLYQEQLEKSLLYENRSAKIVSNFLYNWPRVSRFVFKRKGQGFTNRYVDLLVGQNSYQSIIARKKWMRLFQ
jgi:geranylgeranyl reductase family protein